MALYRNDNGNLSLIAGSTLYADAPIGAIQAFGGSVAPSGWLLCQGQAISRTIYADLFAVIGTNFGVGDGSTTFNLPDPREASLVGAGTNTLNASSITTHNAVNLGAFQDDQLQDHNHYRFQNTNGGAYSGVGGTGAWTPTSTYNEYGSITGQLYNGRKGTTTHGKQLGVNYIIKAQMVSAPADFMEAVDEVKNELNEIGSLISLGTVTYNSIIDESNSSIGVRKITDNIVLVSANIVPKDLTTPIAAGTTLVTLEKFGTAQINEAPFVAGRGMNTACCYFSRTSNTNEAALITSEQISGTQIRFNSMQLVTRTD